MLREAIGLVRWAAMSITSRRLVVALAFVSLPVTVAKPRWALERADKWCHNNKGRNCCTKVDEFGYPVVNEVKKGGLITEEPECVCGSAVVVPGKLTVEQRRAIVKANEMKQGSNHPTNESKTEKGSATRK